jgi:hypothetical protein
MKQINKQPGKKRRIDQEFARIVKRRLKNNLKKIILFEPIVPGKLFY